MDLTSFILTISLISLFVFILTRPHLRKHFDLTAKRASKFKLILLSLGALVSVALIFNIIYLIQQTALGFSKLQGELTSNSSILEELSKHTINAETMEQALIPVQTLIIVSVLISLICFYWLYCSIFLIISEVLAFKYQNKHNDFKMLLSGMANKNASKVADAYFEMKNNKSKSKLFIDQWDEVVKVLLLIGEIQEAEQLNMYLHERSKALNNIPKNFVEFKNRNKVALYDYEQLRIDKNDAAKIKHMSYRQMLKNTLTK